MASTELKASQAATLRHLAASRFYLPLQLSSPEANAAWESMQGFLHHNEFGLALEDAIELGEIHAAPKEYWLELYLAAQNMGLHDQASKLQAKR